ncbi:hypothetical protein BX265_2341 [Streptomyces sp. TLI_235]|nr:hypothetical protein [Streptomyces sp. TLI_235]PBC77590.1 hypothetical protein BX265_2341 [Streptomyces sp. TLI_235]
MPLDLRPRTQAFCRWHGTACQMGARWPVDPPEPTEQDRLIAQMVRAARGEPEPDPEKALAAWYTDRHEPPDPKKQKAKLAELRQLIAETEARNAEKREQIARRYAQNRREREARRAT